MEINEIIKYGETQTVEFKKSMSQMKEGCKALCGMLNTDKGTGLILFGISPDAEVVGLKDTNLDSTQKTLAQHIQQKFDPELICSIELIAYNDNKLIALSGQRPRYIPLYEYDGRAFIKEGSIKRILSLQEKQSLLKRRDRASHNGPWVCDKCGSWVAMLSSIKFTAEGPKKSYDCKCGGEFWPAT
jgi:ATP-dependent DNA helicase RecG